MTPNDNEFDDLEIAIAFYPADEAAAELLKQNFAEEDVFESNAFSGAWIFTVIVSASKGAVGKVLDFFSQHNQRFKGATVKIGKEEISLSGYSLEEVKEFFDSKHFQKALRAVKKA
jgi:hypothetical protein